MAATMDDPPAPADVLKSIVDHPSMPSIRDTVAKLSALPGASAFRGMGLQMLRIQEHMLSLQLSMVAQAIEALESQPDPADDESVTRVSRKRKITVS